MSWQATSRRLSLLLACLAAASACGDGAGRDGSERRETRSGSSLPEGFALRLDRPNRDPADFRVTNGERGLEVRTGPSGILYRPDQSVDVGDFTVSATFTELGAPMGHREGFGLVIGGQGLEGPDQRYTYFLVRADGRYVIKNRVGPWTEEITDGWVPSEAVRVAAMEDGDISNDLSVSVVGDRVRFSCNGAEVAEVPAAGLSIHGVLGVRVNHNLVVRVDRFRVDR
jgi:hypothetical protein